VIVADEWNGRIDPASSGSLKSSAIFASRREPIVGRRRPIASGRTLSLEQSYRRRTIAAGTSHLLVQRVMRERAFDDLVAWIERGVRPAGEDVLASDLSRIGLTWTPILHPDDPLAPRR